MENNEEQVPLQETIYKPTTQDNSSIALKSTKSTSSFTYFAVIVVNLAAFSMGIGLGWPSPVLPKLSGKVDPENNPLGRPATHTEESWIAGLLSLGGIFGPLLSGFIVDKIGRKPTLIVTSVPMLVSQLMAAYANTVLLFYISRILFGIGTGSILTVLPMYLAEIAEDHNRGTLGCSMGAFVTMGLLFSFAVGPFLSIKIFCLISAVPLIIFILVFWLWIPETPHYLASSNQNKQLDISLTKLRNKTPAEIQTEIAEISKAVLESSQNKGGIRDLFRFQAPRKALIITLGMIILQQFAGINAVLSYMQTIFDATGSGLAPEISTIVVGVIQLATTIVTSVLVEKLGRRILLTASALGSCVALIALGLYFYLKANDFKTDTISWLPVSSLILYIVAFNIGLGPVPWAVMAELFSSNVISTAATIVCVICFIGSFIITLFFPMLVLMLGMANSFWSFGLVCFVGAIFIYCVLPETKGKSMQEIQRLLEGKESSNSIN